MNGVIERWFASLLRTQRLSGRFDGVSKNLFLVVCEPGHGKCRGLLFALLIGTFDRFPAHSETFQVLLDLPEVYKLLGLANQGCFSEL